MDVFALLIPVLTSAGAAIPTVIKNMLGSLLRESFNKAFAEVNNVCPIH
jgi:hypothetical protein